LPVTETSGAVFLSYASQDAAAAARICDALRAAGIEVFFDQSALRGGDDWDRQIREHIRSCALFIPLISIQTQSRLEGYFRREWRLAIERMRDIAEQRTFLLPVAIDPMDPARAHVPDAFRATQWSQLPAGQASTEFVRRVAELLDSAPAAPPRRESTVASPAPRIATPWRVGLGLGVVAAAVAFMALRHPLIDRQGPVSSSDIDKSIAVLPFADLSEKHDQQYLADGLSDELLDALARIPGLRVINRPSSFQFRDGSADARAVGTKLGATHIVEGSVRRSGDAVRVTAQLIRASDGSEEWSRSFDSALDNALQLQSRIALALARELEVSVAGTTSLATVQTTNAQAHDLYLRGLHAVDSFTADGEREAAEQFQQAIELDPNFVSAYEMLGYAHTLLAADGFVPVESGFAQLHADAQWLLQRDPRSLMGHWLLAYYHLLYTRDWRAAEREANAALAVNRNGWKAPYLAGRIAMAQGQLERAERLFKTSLVSDPLDADSLCELSLVLRGAHRVQEAQEQVSRCLAITPTYPGASAQLALTLLDQGHGAQARETVTQEVDEGLRWAVTAEIEAALGHRAEAEAALHRAQGVARARPTFIALAYASMGRSDEALQWLDRANKQHDPWLIYLKTSPEAERLADDPRYLTLLHELGLAP